MSDPVIAIIPARSGSKGISDKNLTILGGHPLLAYSIAAAKLSAGIDRVILSTNSQKYADIGASFGAEVPFLRPDDLSTDTSTDREFMAHAMNWIRENEGSAAELWVHLRPTTPLRDPSVIDDAIVKIGSQPDFTSLRSAHPSPESPFKWFQRTDSGCWSTMATSDTNLDPINRPRQSFPDVFVPDGYVDVVRSSVVFNTPFLHGDRALAFESPVCTEVDSPEELELLEFQLNKNGSPLLSYLTAHKGN